MYSDLCYDPDYYCFDDDEPALRPPKRIGGMRAGHYCRRRLNRRLPVGHRWRGDVE